MKEKERYVWSQDFNPESPYDEFDYIVDTKTGKVLDDFEIKDLLNKLTTNKSLKGKKIMIGLYDYDTATKEECINDFEEIKQYLLYCEWVLEDLDTLKKKGQRIQEIAERLKELGGEE